jgi:hypothetical protein
VACGKAIRAGAVGALAWEGVARLLIASGAPLFDIVFVLGTMRGAEPAWIWWPAGIAIHAVVGAIWAIFYGFFFWSTLNRHPIVQGAVFSVLPAFLAGVVMIPQIDLMHRLVLQGEMAKLDAFAVNLGWGGPAGVLLGHITYGIVLGALYTRPVGYPVGRLPRISYG